MENKIIKLIAFGPLIFIPLFVYMIIFFVAKENKNNFEKMLSKVKIDLINTQKHEIKLKVDGIVDLIEYQSLHNKQEIINKLKNEVSIAYKFATKLYEVNKHSKSKKEIQLLINKTLTNFKNSFIIDFNTLSNNLNSKKELFLIKNQTEGVVTTFYKPEDKQLTYLRALGNSDLYIGSTVNLKIMETMNRSALLKSIERVNIDKKNYFFIIDKNGNLLLNNSYQNRENIFPKIFKSLENENSNFLSYMWKDSNTKQIEKRFSYVKKIPSLSWIAGVGFHESTINNTASNNTIVLYSDYNSKVNDIITISIIAVVFSSIISYLISVYLDNTFLKYNKKIKRKEKELINLNNSLESKILDRTKKLEDSKKAFELLATTDNLTQVHNRYSILERLNEEIKRNTRYSTSFCVLMYDIDHFKNVNDTYGHDVGDYILSKSTLIIKDLLRDVDIIGRYGGEEFLIILPNTALNDARIVAERIRSTVESYEFEQITQLTISLGLVEGIDKEEISTLFKRLDNLLYVSKNNGRNRVSDSSTIT